MYSSNVYPDVGVLLAYQVSAPVSTMAQQTPIHLNSGLTFCACSSCQKCCFQMSLISRNATAFHVMSRHVTLSHLTLAFSCHTVKNLRCLFLCLLSYIPVRSDDKNGLGQKYILKPGLTQFWHRPALRLRIDPNQLSSGGQPRGNPSLLPRNITSEVG